MGDFLSDKKNGRKRRKREKEGKRVKKRGKGGLKKNEIWSRLKSILVLIFFFGGGETT